MKRITLLFSLLFAVSFLVTNCEDKSSLNENYFIGEWSSPSSNGGWNGTGLNKWVFTATKVTLYNASGTLGGDYTEDGDNLIISWDDQTSNSFSYSFLNENANIQLYSQGNPVGYLTRL